MKSPLSNQKKIRLTCSNLPLGVYREVAAHLRQVDGVNTSVVMRSLEHDESQKFDYCQSQVEALQIEYETVKSADSLKQVESILDYYAQRYSAWKDYMVINED